MGELEMVLKNIIDLNPADFLRMTQEAPGDIKSFRVLPPVLGKSNDFGKVRVTLARPKYEVRL